MTSIRYDGQRVPERERPAGETPDREGHAGEPPARGLSTGELVAQLTQQMSTLVRDELRLAQLEMARKGRQAGIGVGLMGGSGVIALYAVGCLLASAIIAISGVLAAWLAALIIGGALLLVSALAALIGTGSLRRATPPVPRQTVLSVRKDLGKIRSLARR